MEDRFQTYSFGKKKPATEKTTIMPVFDKTGHSKKISTKSAYGIQNHFLNCWMNCVLQILCGSSLIDVTDDTIVNETRSNLQQISEQLQIRTLKLKDDKEDVKQMD